MADRSGALILKVGEVDDWAVGFASRLAAGETLTGSPDVTVHETSGDEDVYAGITISAAELNTATVTDADEVEHGANEAVEFRITAAGNATPGTYTLRVECATTNGRSPVETFDVLLSGPPEAA